MSSTLRVAKATIRRFLGIEEAAVEPGKVTIIRGKNETAKTSLIEGIRAGLGGGKSLSRFQRIDTTTGQPVEGEPEVLLELAELPPDSPSMVMLHREGDDLDVQRRVGDTAAFEDVGKAQTFVDGLFDARGCNPVAFLNASDKDRARMLLEALPLKLDRVELSAILGAASKHLGPIPDHLHPLEHVAIVREMVFNARTGVNRDHKAKAGSADQLRRNLPAVLPDAAAAEIEALAGNVEVGAAAIASLETAAAKQYDAAIEQAHSTKEIEDNKVTAAFREASRKLRTDHDAEVARWRAELEARIKDALAVVQDTISGLKEADGQKLDEIDKTYEDAREAAERARQEAMGRVEDLRVDLATKRERLAALRAASEDAVKVHERAGMVKQFEEEAASLEVEAAELSAVISNLDAFARRMAEDIPIDGLSIQDKVIRVKGIPYEQLNTAQRIGIAVKVASLRASATRLPVLFVDGAESLDLAHFEVLVAELLKSGMQAFITRVEDRETVVEKRS